VILSAKLLLCFSTSEVGLGGGLGLAPDPHRDSALGPRWEGETPNLCLLRRHCLQDYSSRPVNPLFS